MKLSTLMYFRREFYNFNKKTSDAISLLLKIAWMGLFLTCLRYMTLRELLCLVTSSGPMGGMYCTKIKDVLKKEVMNKF